MPKLRIIAGTYGSRLINAPRGHKTRPMGDRVRSALFNKVSVEGVTVLDAYAGSGALGFEALSRGAEHVDFVENDRRAGEAIKANIAALGAERESRLYQVSVPTFIGAAEKLGQVYDVIFVDPPYQYFTQKPDYFSTILSENGLRKLAKDKGFMVISYPEGLHVPTVNGVVVVDKSNYGEATLAVLRFMNTTEREGADEKQ